MSMTDDWQRLDTLEAEGGTMQYGMPLQIEPSPGLTTTIVASKDLIRFVGKKTDLNAWRTYLGPWQPKPKIWINNASSLITALYAEPAPWAPPVPRVMDAFFNFPLYARIMWGSGGVQHTAFTDWPRRGGVLQTSGSYLQVNALVNTPTAFTSPGAGLLLKDILPNVAATMAPEPGGGDSVQPATFTYQRTTPQEFDPAPAPVVYGQNFQIPPFGRAFVPLLDVVALRAAACSSIRIATQVIPNPIVGVLIGNNVQTWDFPMFTPIVDGSKELGGVDWPLEPFPIAGQNAGVVRIELTFPAEVVTDARFLGCMFYLDL